MSAEQVARKLIDTVEQTAQQLRAVDAKTAAVKPAPRKWSKKEILGHLLDSAVNNHHRFVRTERR